MAQNKVKTQDIAFNFSNSNGITFGTNGQTITASYNSTQFQSTGNYLTSQSNQNALAANGNFNFQTISFSNANGVSFVTSAGSAIAASVVTSYRASNDAIGLNTAFSNVTATANSSGLSIDARGYAGTGTTFAGTNVSASVTLNSNGLNFALSAPSAAAGNVTFSAGTASSGINAVTFSNANGVSFGLGTGASAGVITATVATNYLTTAAFSNQVVNSLNGSTGQISLNVGSSLSSSTNGSSITFGLASNITTALQSAGNYLTTARGSTDAVGLNTAQTNVTWTVNSSGISFNASGYAGTGTSATNASITLNSNGLQISVAPPGAGAAISAGANSQNTGTVNFANSNGISFGLSNNGTMTASYTVPTQSVVPGIQSIQVSNTTYTTGNVIFSNANGFSFGSSAGGAITGSYTVPTQTNQNISLFALGNTTQNSSTVLNASNLSFNAIGSLTVGYSAGSIQFSAPNAITTARASTDAIGLNTAQTNVTWTVNSSGISFNAGGYAGTGTSATNASVTLNSNGLAISVAAPGAALVNFSAGTTSNNLGSVVFSNLNGVSFGLNGSTITASVSPSGAGGVNIAASNTTFTAGTVVMSAQSGAITISSGAQSVMFQVPATSLLSATGKVSISTNGSTISIGAPNDYTYGYFDILTNIPIGPLALMSTGTNLVFPILLPNISFSRIDVPLFYSNATNSTGSHTGSVWIGIYTKNAATLSLLSSQSTSYGMSGSGTLNSSINAGLRLFTMGFTGTLTAGNYWLAQVFNSSSSSMNGTINLWANSGNAAAAQMGGIMGVATNNTNQLNLGFGLYSSSGYTMPNSMAFSQITGSVAGGFRMNKVIFNGSNIN